MPAHCAHGTHGSHQQAWALQPCHRRGQHTQLQQVGSSVARFLMLPTAGRDWGIMEIVCAGTAPSSAFPQSAGSAAHRAPMAPGHGGGRASAGGDADGAVRAAACRCR